MPANVPIRASVAITPRTRSFATALVIASPMGRSISASQAAAVSVSPPPSTFRRISDRLRSGCNNVGQIREVTSPHRR